MRIADLPFHERPILELLALDDDGAAPARAYAGYGWARCDALTLSDDRCERALRDVLVVAAHASDVQPDDVPAGDLELEFELPDGPPVAVLASTFLATWLPRLPRVGVTVLAICNPGGRAWPNAPSPTTTYAARGEVVAWLDERDHAGTRQTRLRLAAEEWTSR